MAKEELWKCIAGVDGYIVSNTGKVMSLPKLGDKITGKTKTNGKSGKLLSPRKQYQGYWQVGLWINGKHKFEYVHRLVAKAFLKSRRGCDVVMHIDDNPSNNDVSNLKWGTHYENSQMIKNFNPPNTRGNMEANRFLVSELIKHNMKNYSGTMKELLTEISKDLGISYQYVIHLWYHRNPYKVNVNKMKNNLVK